MIDNSGRRGRTATCPDAEGPVAEFARGLWELKKAAGDLSYDRMRTELGALASKSALSAAARGERLPSWDTTWEFVRVLAVRVLGEPEDEVRARWRARWERARDAAAAGEPRPEQPGATPPVPRESGLREPRQPAPERPAAAPETAQSEAAQPQPAQPQPGHPGPRGHRRRRSRAVGITAVVAAVVVLAGGVIAATRMLRTPPEPPDAGATTQEPLAPLIPGDRSLLLSDLSAPDGTEIPTGTVFTKTWEFRNAGTVAWVDRYLRREGSFGDDDGCVTPERVPIPDTRPGETVRVAVEVRAPDEPGYCQVYWKMVDAKGRLLLPGVRAVYFFVQIVD